MLIGETQGDLGQSLYLREIWGARKRRAARGRSGGRERRNGDFVRRLIGEGAVDRVHDVSDGGSAGGDRRNGDGGGHRRQHLASMPLESPVAFWFGEDQARYVVTVREEDRIRVLAGAATAQVPMILLGHSGGDSLSIAGERPILVADLRRRFESWLPDYMAGASAT